MGQQVAESEYVGLNVKVYIHKAAVVWQETGKRNGASIRAYPGSTSVRGKCSYNIMPDLSRYSVLPASDLVPICIIPIHLHFLLFSILPKLPLCPCSIPP